MAIPKRKKVIEPPQGKTDSQKFFIDREIQRETFLSRMGEVSPEESQLIYYAGTGGVGKSALIEYLEKYLVNTSKAAKFKSVRYDFTHGAEMLTTLNALKKFLVDTYGAEFPLFEKGLLSYYQKCGDAAGVMEIQNILKESAVIKKSRKYLDTALKKSFDANTLSTFVNKIFDESIEILGLASDTIPFIKIAKLAVDAIDKYLKEIERFRLENDKNYRDTTEELKKREASFTPEAIKSYLPILFAKDISYWLNQNDLNLIIFLDTYENLTGDEKDVKRHEKIICKNNDVYEYKDVPVDWWIEELLYDIDRTLWVIAGRGEISKIGSEIEIAKGDDIFTLSALENKFAEEFLIKAGVTDENLRGGIVKLTGGYPNYLTICVDTYKEILATGRVPTLADFGDKRESVINRLMDFMNDATRNMVKRLCILGTWTDVFAMRVLSILHENNRDTYNRVKKLSFVTAQTEKIFTFDKTIQKILFDHLRKTEENFILETRNAATKFFNSAFHDVDAEENKNISAADRKLFFKFWCEIILRTTDGAEFLMKQYIENLAPLSYKFSNDVIEGVIKNFQAKIKDTDGRENIPFAYFEHLLSDIKLNQDKIKDALELAESAYNKFESLPLKESHAEIKISVIRALADVYKELKRTAAEIELREKIVAECEKFYRDKTNKNIIDAKYKLADAFKRGDKKNKALEVYAEIYHSLEPLNDEKTIDAADKYAETLEDVNKYNNALPLREKIVAFYRNTDDTWELLSAIRSLISLLEYSSFNDNAEKILELQREKITLNRKFYGEYPHVVYDSLEDFCNTLKKLNRADEAKRALENFASEYKARLDTVKNFEDKVNVIEILTGIYNELNRKADVKIWSEKLRQILRDDIAVKTREPIEDFAAAIDAIETLQGKLSSDLADYREEVSLQHKIIELLQKNPDATADEIISAQGDLADILARKKEGYDEARALREEIVDYYKAKYPDDETHEDILRAMNDLEYLLENDIADYNAALTVLTDIHSLQVQKNDDATNILEVMNNIASLYFYQNNYSEQLKWRKDILNFCRENFVADSPEVIRAMEELSGVYEDMNEYDAAENLRREIADIKGVKHGDDSNYDVIFAKKQIAYRLHDAGKYDEELKLRNEIVELERKNHAENGGDRYEIISALDDVADLLDDMGREDEVIEIRKKIVKEYKDDYADIVKNLGETSDDAIYKLEDIAFALNRVGDYEEELKYRKKIVELRIASDEFSDHTVRALENLADFYSETGDEAEEFKTRLQVVAIRKEMLKNLRAESDDNEEINIALYALAIAENYVGNFDEGAYWEDELIAKRRRAVEKFEDEFGRTDSETINALKNLAYDLDNYQLYDEELKVRREIVDRLQEIYPDEVNEEIFSAKCNLATMFYYEENYREYLIACQEIAKLQPQIEDDVDSIVDKLDDVANVLEYLEDFHGAISEREKIIALLKENYSDDSEEVIDAEEKLENLRDKLNAENIDEEIVEDDDVEENFIDESDVENLQEILNMRREVFGNEHYRTLELREELANDLEKISRADESVKLREENLTAYEKIMNRRLERFGESHRIILTAMYNYAAYLEKLQRYDDAEKIYRRLCAAYKNKFADDKTNHRIIYAQTDLAALLTKAEKFDAAISVQNEIVELLTRQYEGYENHSAIAKAKNKVDSLLEMKENYLASLSEPHEEIDKNSSVSLRRGQKFDLTKNNPELSNLIVKFGWHAANNFEIDHSAFLLGANGKVKVDEDFIFYNNPRHETGGVEYVENPAQINVDLSKIPDDVFKIDFTLTIYDADIKAQNFSKVESAYIAVIDAQNNFEMLRFDLNENFTIETAIVAGAIYRHKGDWKFNAVGAGFVGGLQSLCKNFGISL